MEHMQQPFLTCEAVLTEAMFLVRQDSRLRESIVQMLGEGFLKVDFHVSDHHAALLAMIERYNNVPMSLADACLVRMSELLPKSHVFTLDSDFHIYRKSTRHVIPTIAP
jgi:predicted nucleic acid-binding protein